MKSLLGGKSKTAAPASAAQKGLTQKEKKKAEDEEIYDNLLPWEVENKVSFLFSSIKVPFILFVGFFGSMTEWQVRDLTLDQWQRDHLHSTGPSCYVHKLDVARYPKVASFSLIKFLNETIMFGHLGEERHLTLADIEYELAHKDMCGFTSVDCRPDASMQEEDGGGAMHLIPLAILWTVYKLMFIGVHPVDRAMRKMFDKPPYMKLLTEPHFRVCNLPMAMIVKLLFYVRYRLMPNVLMTALATMEMHPECKSLLRYRYDWFWSTMVYWMILYDMVLTGGLYVMAVKNNAQFIGTGSYRCYKAYWFLSSIIPATLVFWDIAVTVQWNFFRLIRFSLHLAFTFDLSFAFYVDFLQAFLFFIVVFEIIEFWVFILQLCCPKIASKLPLEALDKLPFMDDTSGKLADEEDEDASLLPATGTVTARSTEVAPAPAAASVAAPAAKAAAKAAPKAKAVNPLAGMKAALGPLKNVVGGKKPPSSSATASAAAAAEPAPTSSSSAKDRRQRR